jgi:L1 cell adhesion molecule like protein
LFLFFRATGHTNYTLESFNLLCHYYYLLPPRYAEQLIWSRFVNTHGSSGRNVSADLHMEHLNRVCKDAVAHLGAKCYCQNRKGGGRHFEYTEQF